MDSVWLNTPFRVKMNYQVLCVGVDMQSLIAKII